MTVKPRKRVRPNQVPKAPPREEFRNCDAPGGCPNIVSIRNKPVGYSGPIFCILHAHLTEKT